VAILGALERLDEATGDRRWAPAATGGSRQVARSGPSGTLAAGERTGDSFRFLGAPFGIRFILDGGAYRPQGKIKGEFCENFCSRLRSLSRLPLHR